MLNQTSLQTPLTLSLTELAPTEYPAITASTEFNEGFAWGRMFYHDEFTEAPPTCKEVFEYIKSELTPENIAHEQAHREMAGEPFSYKESLGLVAGFLAEYAQVQVASFAPVPHNVAFASRPTLH